jgi:hypothetical protein
MSNIEDFPIDWFLSTAQGSPWDGLVTEAQYENALLLTYWDNRMQNVLKFCPNRASAAMAIGISLVLSQTVQQDGASSSGGGQEKVAYVIKDHVHDFDRQYQLEDAPELAKQAVPANSLKTIFEQCQPPMAAMFLARASSKCGGGCNNYAGININLPLFIGDFSDG